MDTAVHAVEFVGAATLRGLRAIGRNSRFVAETVGGFRDVSTWPEQTIVQARRLGVDSLPIALFIAVFTGIVLALLASYSFTGAVPLYFVGTLVEKTVTLELAPVLSGLALARNVSADIAAELGAMRVTEQIDALKTLGYDPFSFLVVPACSPDWSCFPSSSPPR